MKTSRLMSCPGNIIEFQNGDYTESEDDLRDGDLSQGNVDNQTGVKDRKLNSPPPRAPDPREDLLEAIRSEPKLKPTPGRIVETSRTKLNEEDATPYMTRKVIKPDASLFVSNSFEEDDEDDDEEEEDEEEEDVFKSPIEDQKRLSVEPAMLSPLTPLCPTLETPIQTHWQHKVFLDVVRDPKSPPERRHSITVCETPHAAPKQRSVQSSLECLSLTIDEVMHIRNVLTKAELECLLVNPELHDLVAKGKVCFTCKKTKFALFGMWSTKCKFCRRSVCSKCVSKMRIPTEHFEHIPVYTLSPSPMSPGSSRFDFLFPYEKTGSVPNSPDVPRRASSVSPPTDIVNNNGDHVVSMSGGGKRGRPKTITFGSPSPDMSQSSFNKNNMSRPPLQRSHTTTKPPPPKQLQGPVMNICKDCKAMIINVIRASRTSLAKAPHLAKQKAMFDHPGHRASRNFHLDLKPVYK